METAQGAGWEIEWWNGVVSLPWLDELINGDNGQRTGRKVHISVRKDGELLAKQWEKNHLHYPRFHMGERIICGYPGRAAGETIDCGSHNAQLAGLGHSQHLPTMAHEPEWVNT